MVVEMDEVEVGRVEKGAAFVPEDATDRRALVGDDSVAVDDGDDIAAVLHERSESLFAAVELGGALLDAQFEVGGERQVLEQRRDLADDGEHEERQRVPTEEAPEPAGDREPERAEEDHEHDRHVRHEHREPIGHIVVRALRFRIGGAHRPGQEDRRERAEPSDVDEAAGRVGTAVRQVDEAAVGDREREQPGEEQRPAGPARRCPLAAVARREQQDRDDDDVAERVGEADRQREPVAAGVEQWAEDEHPAHEQQGAGDEEAVQDGADPARQAPRDAREGEQRGGGQRHESQVPDVGDRRERHLSPEHRFVPGPGGLTAAPRQAREPEESPRPGRVPGLAAAACDRLDAGPEGDRHETEIRDELGGRAVRVQRQKCAPRDAHGGRDRGDAADPPQ